MYTVTQVWMPRLAMAFIAVMFSIAFTVPAFANNAGTTNNSNAETLVATSAANLNAASADEDDDDC